MDVGFASVFMIILLDFVIVATVWYFFYILLYCAKCEILKWEEKFEDTKGR